MKYNWQEWKLQKEGFSAYDPDNDDPADDPNYDSANDELNHPSGMDQFSRHSSFHLAPPLEKIKIRAAIEREKARAAKLSKPQQTRPKNVSPVLKSLLADLGKSQKAPR